MIPTQIKLNHDSLFIRWDDGSENTISIKKLRDACPCAGCRGETVLLKTYTPEPQPELPGKYELKNIQQVGHYAVQLTWGDGHATGIYPWQILRSL